MRTGAVVWLTGLTSAGKSTIGDGLAKRLLCQNARVEHLDADEFRKTFSRDLGYSMADRDENTLRLAWVASLLARHGVIAIVSAVSPLRMHRDRARAMTPAFVEVHVKASLSVVQARDVKGLYAKAAQGLMNGLPGLHQPYEEPLAPEVLCDTEIETPDESITKVLRFLKERVLEDSQPRAERRASALEA